ncbi:MAG TPA: class I SAM-dependent methyltransferase [Anaerolineae bacterium]|nr:class I SAM-dependent methyltransferase [Anaerolineae bacterium]
MNLTDIVRRTAVPEPWAEGENIPWNDPDFSARMLQEHLSQEHDAASRRFEKIDRHIAWIHTYVLGEKPSTILDLGCGPGLYASRLAQRGHTCVGIDFGPASIAYARAQAERESLACTYRLEDLRTADFGAFHTDYDLAMLIFGEFNVFKPEDIRHILRKAHAVLRPGGKLVLEPHTFAAVKTKAAARQAGMRRRTGYFPRSPTLFSRRTSGTRNAPSPPRAITLWTPQPAR